jgi:hypothetical protein
MTYPRLTLILLLLLLAMATAMPVYAQSSDVGQQILSYIRPRPNAEIWDLVFVYPLFLVGILTLFLQGDKELRTTLIMALVLFLIVLSKLAPFGIFDTLGASLGSSTLIFGYPSGLLLLVIHCGIGLLPLIVAAMTKSKRSRLPALMMGLWGLVYTVAFGFLMM